MAYDLTGLELLPGSTSRGKASPGDPHAHLSLASASARIKPWRGLSEPNYSTVTVVWWARNDLRHDRLRPAAVHDSTPGPLVVIVPANHPLDDRDQVTFSGSEYLFQNSPREIRCRNT